MNGRLFATSCTADLSAGEDDSDFFTPKHGDHSQGQLAVCLSCCSSISFSTLVHPCSFYLCP